MKEHKNFALGVNNAQPPQEIDDREVSDALNVEYDHSNNLQRRRTTMASELNDALSQLKLVGKVSNYILWAAKVMPKDSYGSFVYFMFTTDLEMYIVYKTAGSTWKKTPIEIDGIVYTSDSKVSFLKSYDRVIIVDTVNKSHFVKIDKDGIIVPGILEYPAPIEAPKINPLTEFDSDRFETNYLEGYLGKCGFYVYCYCYADEGENLSNPSPFSDPVNVQLNRYDETTGDVDRWVEHNNIGNLTVPSLDNETLAKIKKFYVFRAYYKNSEGSEYLDWDLYNVFNINDIKAPNSYIDTENYGDGQSLDYGNTAPVAEQAILQSDSIFLAGCKTKDDYLWEMEWSFPINVDNKNENIKLNKIYRIRITQDNLIGLVDGEEVKPFVVNDFFDINCTVERLRKLCFFDSQKTTPLKSILIQTGVTVMGSIPFADFFVAIPVVTYGKNLIYFCFTTLANMDNFGGIPYDLSTGTNRHDYGRIFIVANRGHVPADDWSLQKLFRFNELENDNNIISAPMFFKSPDKTNDIEEVINRYDANANGVLTNCVWGEANIINVPYLKSLYGGQEFPITTKWIQFNGEASKLRFGELDANNEDNVNVNFWYRFNTGDVPEFYDSDEYPNIAYQDVNFTPIYYNFYRNGDKEGHGWVLAYFMMI